MLKCCSVKAMMELRTPAYVFLVLVLCSLVKRSSAFDVENLKIGCFSESPSSRQFFVSPGDYQPENLTPYACVKLCGNMKYNFAALQNGNLCFCTNTFNASQTANASCNINCTGEQRYKCGGIWATLVYNSTSYVRKFVINYSSPLRVFEWVNTTAGFVNESAPGLQVAFNIGDENGDSPSDSEKFNFRASYWGTIIIRARPVHINPKLDYVNLELTIRAKPQRAEFTCPNIVRTGETFRCIAKIHEGTGLQATWLFQNGDAKNLSLPNPLYVRAGPAIPQWVVPGLTSLNSAGVFLLPSSQVLAEARILALEIYGHTAGEIKVFVMRPVCTSPTPHFCPKNLSCSDQPCSIHPSYACSSPNILCASKSCCYLPPSGNCSRFPLPSTLQASNLIITADIGVLAIKTGYNLHVLSKEKTLNVLPGDMIAWGPVTNGTIAHRTGKAMIYHFSALDANVLRTGSNVSLTNSQSISDLTYMINIIGSQASTFELSHQHLSSGEYWAQVNFTDTLGNAWPADLQCILVQDPINSIKAVYPLQEFSFFGARLNHEIVITINISSNTNVTVSWTLVNTSTVLKQETLQNLGNDFVIGRLNQSFASFGTYNLFVEAANNVSTVNTTILVYVQDALSDFNVSLISNPVYLGAPTKFNVSVQGSNVKFKWAFGDGSWTSFISNTSVEHRFSKLGSLNVTVTADNLAYSQTTWLTVSVLNPLSITVPLQGAVGLPVNLSCSLVGPFASDQHYYWDYDDSSTEQGLNKNEVSHNYSKGGTYLVSVRIQNAVYVNTSSEILILEPISGLTLDNVTGIELFDNKTFIARTKSGNKLTYEWYLHGNKTTTILICTNNSIELYFNETGFYTMSVNVSNSISSDFASISFYAQQRITGLGITAFPNPAPSNSTITFNLTKGTGSNVKYRLDFGDGFVLREFPPNYLFNRTFTSGQWQIIFTGVNTVNHVIVFYNVTVQDPVKNITVGFTAETESHGRRIVAVGSDTSFYSLVSQGTDVYFRWNFGDGSNSYTFKGTRTLTGRHNHSVGHSFSHSGEFNVTVKAFNVISQLDGWVTVHAQQKIERFELIVTDRASPGESIVFRFSQSKEDNVSYIINFGDGGSSQITTANTIAKTYNSTGVFNVTAEAVNQISSQKITKTIIVQHQIQGLAFVHPIRAVETGLQTVISWVISDGSDVKFVIDYGDGTGKQTMDTSAVGMNVTVLHNYTTSGEYSVAITAYNLVGPNLTISDKAMVDDPIVGLVAYAERSTIQMYENATIVVKIFKGSRVTYNFDFGDGSTPVETLNNGAIHQYVKHGVFNVSVTARNSLASVQTQLNDTITVEKPNQTLEIRGLNVSCLATIPGNASEVRISYAYGYMFQCEVDFGDTTKETFTDATLPLPLLHTYSTVGRFEVIVKCENQFGSHTVNTTARVDAIITGLRFSTGSGMIQKEFGQSVVVEWVWSTGTNIHLTVTLLNHGPITSQQTGQTCSVELDRTLCPTPGEYVVEIELSNSVSPPQKLTARVTFLEEISGLTARVNPVARTGSPILVYVSVESGVDVNVNWKYGDGGIYTRQIRGHGSQTFVATHVYSTQGEFQVEVVTSNQNSIQRVQRNITVLSPVQGFSFHQNNTVILPTRNITFQFNRSAQSPHLFNATYRIEFGNGESTKNKAIDPAQTQFSYCHLYAKPGCYKAKLIIWNFVSRVELLAPVEIIETITNAQLKAMHSKYSAHPGSSGGGQLGNTFPLEYPVSFTVTQDTGTCLKYNWSYGDDDELRNASTAVTTHVYPLPGSYEVIVKVYNSLGEETLRRTVTLQYSVMGLYLASSGPAKPGESVTFVVFCSSLGTNSRFVFNAGDGNNITLRNFKNNTVLKAEKHFLDPNINLPFDPSSYYAKVYSHIYSGQGLFEAQVWGWNDASQQSVRTMVVITDKPVPELVVQVVGGHKSLSNASSLIYGKQFSLSSRVEILSNESYSVTFKWVVYKEDSYHARASSSRLQLPPESGREASLPSHVLTNQSSIIIPALGLGPGEYIFQLTVIISGVGVANTEYTYIRIAGADIEASIVGGDLRSHNWEQQLILDASKSRDPLFPAKEELDYTWFCNIIEGDPAIVKLGLGCFGNTKNQVNNTGNVLTFPPRSLFEATTYAFTVSVSSTRSGRWSKATQTVKVLMGNPPDIRISCDGSNCGKYLNHANRLILKTTCLNCDDIQAISYNWSAEDVKTSALFPVWPDRALTLRNFQNAVILGNTFKSGASYTVRVVASRPNSGAKGFAEYNIKTNQPPKGGTCDVTPNTGEELETRFSFSCSDWKDEHEPLNYEMFYSYPRDSQDPSSSENGVLFFYGPSLTKAEFLFLAGKEDDGHIIEIMVIIKDAYGEAVESKLQIKVKPRIVTKEELKTKTLAPGNEIEKALNLGSKKIAVQLINVVSNILNNQNDSTDSSVEELNQRIRLMMIKYLAAFPIQTLDDVLLSSQTLQAATDVAKETTVEAQVLAAKQYATMAKKLTKESQGGEDGGVIEKLSKAMLKGLSNAFLASTSISGERSNDIEKEASQEVLDKVLSLVDTVSDAVLYTMIPEQTPVVMETKGVAIGLSKPTSHSLAGLSVDVGGEGQFVLPNNGSLINKTRESSFITATVTALSTNPFQSSSNSTLVKSDPISLVLKGSDGNVLPVEGLTSPINIFLPQEDPPQISLNTSQTPSTSGSMTLHKVTLPNNHSIIKAEILPSNGSSGLTVFFRYNQPPSQADYDFKTTLPHQDSSVGSNYTVLVANDQMREAGDYYFGVLPSAHDNNLEPTGTTIDYTFDVISTACYFWNETSSDWSSKGCRVHKQSTRSLTRCQCTHLTWFGADLFIPPNKLDINASLKKLAQIHKHPALLATYCVIIGLYILALVWARRKDRKDITKVGLVPVLDNDPADRYRYEVTVYTARGKKTGTTANVSILIAGEDGQSAVHMLKSTSRLCQQPGGVDSFLVTTPDCLGSLTFIRIWHDNTGKSPSWFLSQVVIRDIETEEKFFFLCNHWLACDEGDGQVDRLFPVAGKDELRDFVHLFKNKTSRDFSDGHLWFSIAFRPVRSRFTCVQRVSCCLSLLMCSMLANVLWYRTPMEKQNSVLIDFGFFEFTWHEIIIGIQSSLIVFPINLLIVQLFRNRAVSPKAKQKYAERTITRKTPKISETEKPSARKQTAVSLSDITPTNSESEQAVPKQKIQVTRRNLTSMRAPVVPRKDSWDEEIFASLLESQISVSSGNKEKDSKKQKTLEKDDLVGEVPDFLSSDIYYYKYQGGSRDHEKALADFPESVCSRGSVESTDALVSTDKLKEKKKRKKLTCLFPWWFVYIAWFFCLSTAAAAGFFTLLYGLQFDNKQQEDWLVSMFVSMFQDILISQPLKVIIIAILFALLLKKPQDEEDDVINSELAHDEEWLEKNLTHASKGEAKTAVTQSQHPPDKILLHAARVRLFKERKMHSVLREIVFYFLFVWMVLLIAYGHRDPYAHFMTQNMEYTFVGRHESPGVREDDRHETAIKKNDGDDTIKLADVTNTIDFWEWMNQTLVPALFNGMWYNGKSGEPGFVNDKMSYVVGVARVRQLRVKSGTCNVDRVIKAHLGACDEPYSWEAEDQTPSYARGWKPANENSSYNSDCSAWRYKTTAELKTRPFLGHLALYRGGGYKVDLGSTVNDAYSLLNDLKVNGWVDKYTRAVFVEFTVYNGHTNLYCVANLLLEFTAAGGVVPFIQLLSTRIDRYVGHFLIFVLVCEVSFVLFTLLFTYREFKRFLKSKLKNYLSEFWTWIELTLIGLSWTSIVLYAIRFGLDKYTKKSFRENPGKFVDFQHLALVDQLFGYVYAFVVFITSVKFLRLFRFNRRMSLLGSTIKTSARELVHFGIIFGLVFVGFAHLCYLVFSHELYKFHTFVTTVETLISVMLGKFSYVNLERANRVLGPLMFFFYSVGVVFILINMFLSIIIENFNKVKQHNDLQSNEHEIIDFITEQFLNWLGFKSRSIFRNRVGAGAEHTRPKYKKKKRIDETQKLKERVDRLVTLIKKVHFDVKEDDDFLRNDGEVTYLVPEIQLESYA